MTLLASPVPVGALVAPSRVVFGPHETNLGERRSFSARHVAYYERRARGGAGVIVLETASVHESDWPYERSPLAEHCADGWAAVAAACHAHGSLVLAGLGHCGGQGSSAYSQAALWAPSRFADALSREVPVPMEHEDIAALLEGFSAAARLAAAAGLDGVEIDAGPWSLLRQFLSGLTNQRDDDYGSDRARLAREVLAEVRLVLGPGKVLGLRLSGDELAPWAGVTPEQAIGHARDLAGAVDLLTVVRGGPYSTTAYRPDSHTEPGFNLGLCRSVREAIEGRAAVVLQGSVVDSTEAEAALEDGGADLVEMTRALIADARLVEWVRAGSPERVRPCLLCNQACQVRDVRNPIVSCVVDPSSGHEKDDDPADDAVAARPPVTGSATDVLVVGAGPAGLECARVLAALGRRPRVAERAEKAGGMLRTASRGVGRERFARFGDWLEAECDRLGVVIQTATTVGAAELERAESDGLDVVLATGSRPRELALGPSGPDAPAVLDVVSWVEGWPRVDAASGAGAPAAPPVRVAVLDPVGGPVGVASAEWFAAQGHEVSIVTQDQVVGTALSRTGDLADANGRLQRAGIARELRARPVGTEAGGLVVEDVWTARRRVVACDVVIDCGHRLPDEALYLARPGTARAGDCVAPRTLYEAVLEGRRTAFEIASRTTSRRAVAAGLEQDRGASRPSGPTE